MYSITINYLNYHNLASNFATIRKFYSEFSAHWFCRECIHCEDVVKVLCVNCLTGEIVFEYSDREIKWQDWSEKALDIYTEE